LPSGVTGRRLIANFGSARASGDATSAVEHPDSRREAQRELRMQTKTCGRRHGAPPAAVFGLGHLEISPRFLSSPFGCLLACQIGATTGTPREDENGVAKNRATGYIRSSARMK